MGDYRLVDGQDSFDNISDGKNTLLLQIKQQHPRSKNHYSLVRAKKRSAT